MEQPEPSGEIEKPPRIVFPVIVLVLCTYFFFFDVGEMYMDRARSLSSTFSIAMALAGMWTVRNIFKRRQAALARLKALSIIAATLALPIVGGILTGKEVAYPSGSRTIVAEVRAQARAVKALKAQISQARSAFTEPEQLVSIEPLVASWKKHLEDISGLDARLRTSEIPSVVARLFGVMERALVYDKEQIANIERQIALIRNAKARAKTDLEYNKALLLLEEQEGEIENKRAAQKFDEQIVEIVTGRSQ